MIHRYRNTRTGAVIESPCQISGGGWVEIKNPTPTPPAVKAPEPPKQEPVKQEPARKRAKKK